ncbi:STAS domain-containing protein [Nocardioides montaniterrae]
MVVDVAKDGPTLVLSGDFDVRSTGQVREAINDQLEQYDGDITVDMRGVECIDVTALKVLAAASRRALKAGHHVVLCGTGPSVRRMLHLTHLIRVVELERDDIPA